MGNCISVHRYFTKYYYYHSNRIYNYSYILDSSRAQSAFDEYPACNL